MDEGRQHRRSRPAAIIDYADRRRVEQRLAHRCARWGEAYCAGDPVPASVLWTLESAAAGRLPHRPVRAAAPVMAAVS
jgi:hypothetical protein